MADVVAALSPVQTAAVAAARHGLDGSRPAVAAHDPWWAIGLELLLPETALFCVQRTGAVDILRARGVDVFCLAEHIRHPSLAYMSAVDIFTHQAAADFGAALGPYTVIAIRPNSRLRTAIEGAGGAALGSLHSLDTGRRFENKLAFVEIARAAGVPTPRWEVASAEDAADYAGLSRRLGPRLVVQAPRGNAGQRTWLVDDQVSLDAVRAAESNRLWRVAEMVEGLPFTANGIAGPGRAVSPAEPSRQVTGVGWLTPMALGSSGNAYGDPVLAGHADAIRDVLAALGAALVDAGYAGMYGVDFVLGPDGPVVIETNPRLVASAPLASQLEMAAGRVPALLGHLLAGLAAEAGAVEVSRPLGSASQVMVRRLADDPQGRPEMRSGVYRLAPGRAPEYLREGLYLHELAAQDEALVLAREADEPVSPGKEFARVFVLGPGAEIHPGMRELVSALRGVDLAAPPRG